ncbi:MAG: 3-deoxy-D-manno-octulosonic acid transferase [Syntrophales bacterium]|nr:3-deoxy-D-manno-octulosonic acid transferase [Syntrophales bacterium]
MFALYNILLWIVTIFAVPYYLAKMTLTGKYRKSLGQKFGFISPDVISGMKGSPRIWVHAVSVGEVTAAAPVIVSLRDIFPEACIVLSTSTETGQEMARRFVPAATSYIYYPLDIPFVTKKVIGLVKPDLFVPTETELWPNFIRTCKERGVRIVVINGRISPRSFRGYAITRFFWKGILNAIEEIGVISEVDARRVKTLGMPPSRVHILGNAKYDSLAAKVSPNLQADIARRLKITPGEKVFVAGSTHEGEEKIILRVYQKLLKTYPDFKLIIIPRHVERSQEVFALVKKEGFEDSITMTEIIMGRKRFNERVIIIDVIGELFKVYSLATVVFCGGSLVPRGGQNILEPAAWGKVIFYGPSMEDFRDEKALLEQTGAGITIRSDRELLEGILELMGDTETFTRKGKKGKEMVAANVGAAERYAALIRKALLSLKGMK